MYSLLDAMWRLWEAEGCLIAAADRRVLRTCTRLWRMENSHQNKPRAAQPASYKAEIFEGGWRTKQRPFLRRRTLFLPPLPHVCSATIRNRARRTLFCIPCLLQIPATRNSNHHCFQTAKRATTTSSTTTRDAFERGRNIIGSLSVACVRLNSPINITGYSIGYIRSRFSRQLA